MKKKITKKTKQEIKLELLNFTLENKKRVYEVYIKAIVKYNIKNLAYSAIQSDELYHNEIMKKMGDCRKNKKSFINEMFGGSKLTEEERIKESIDHYEKLINYVRWKISNLEDEIKTKIAKDAVEKGYGWLKLSSENQEKKK